MSMRNPVTLVKRMHKMPQSGLVSMKKILPVIVFLIAVYVGWTQLDRTDDFKGVNLPSVDQRFATFGERDNGQQVEGSGVVIKLLPDDNDGRRHQKFILRLDSGQTLLVAHNIDLAPRIDALREGHVVKFNGVYEWKREGGVIHWTHHDPDGRHEWGFLEHEGELYR